PAGASLFPYTTLFRSWGLLGSMPKMDNKGKELQAIPGSPPDLKDPPKGCPFAARCPYAMKVCKDHMPDYTELSDTQKSACWLLEDRKSTRLNSSHVSI